MLSTHHVYCIFEFAYCIHKICFFVLSKVVHCFLIKLIHYFLHKLFLAFCIKLFSVQHYFKNCSLSFMRILFSVHYLKKISLFSHKTPSKIVFSKFKLQIWIFFMFEFHNNRIYFFALIKSVSTLIKFSLYTSYLLYIQVY